MNTVDRTLVTEDAAYVAERLNVSRAVVMMMARAGEIPMFKVGRYWRISADTLEDWIKSRETAYRRTPSYGARR